MSRLVKERFDLRFSNYNYLIFIFDFWFRDKKWIGRGKRFRDPYASSKGLSNFRQYSTSTNTLLSLRVLKGVHSLPTDLHWGSQKPGVFYGTHSSVLNRFFLSMVSSVRLLTLLLTPTYKFFPSSHHNIWHINVQIKNLYKNLRTWLFSLFF